MSEKSETKRKFDNIQPPPPTIEARMTAADWLAHTYESIEARANLLAESVDKYNPGASKRHPEVLQLKRQAKMYWDVANFIWPRGRDRGRKA